jgi:hypothetical protein
VGAVEDRIKHVIQYGRRASFEAADDGGKDDWFLRRAHVAQNVYDAAQELPAPKPKHVPIPGLQSLSTMGSVHVALDDTLEDDAVEWVYYSPTRRRTRVEVDV